jgi:hypothetical protein
VTPPVGLLFLAALAGVVGRAAPPLPLPTPPVPAPSPSPVRLSPGLVLARYGAVLGAVKRPQQLVFAYTVEQLGLQDLEQSHRVYRSGHSERDETLVVDGYTLQYPSIRIFRNRSDRYDIAAVAPRLGAYAFRYAVGQRPVGDSYLFKTARLSPGAFAVTQVEIDGRTFLPSVVRFTIVGNGARGSGELIYAGSQTFWLVRRATVSTHLTSGKTARERITWSNYQFPTSLPPSTFAPPRPVTTPPAAPTPTPTPNAAPLSPN